jgi:hypothetical protein
VFAVTWDGYSGPGRLYEETEQLWAAGEMRPMRRPKVAILLAFAIVAIFTLGVWWDETGCFSYRNYKRIHTGMRLEDIEDLLACPGEEIPPTCLMGVPPYAKPSGSPPGWLGVVRGDRFFLWESENRKIFVGVTDGRVMSKCHRLACGQVQPFVGCSHWQAITWIPPLTGGARSNVAGRGGSRPGSGRPCRWAHSSRVPTLEPCSPKHPGTSQTELGWH